MSYPWIRLWAALVRFGTLRLTNAAFKGLPIPSWIVRPLFGGRIHLDLSRSSAQQLLLLEGERFVEERHLLRRLLRPGMTVVDVGANIGYYLLLFQQSVGTGGRVICVEPSIENLPELRKNIAENSTAGVVLHEVALGAEDGSIGLHTGINGGIADATAAAYIVPIRRLDTLVGEHVDLLKIDVEGYEGQVLDGANSILEDSRPTIFLELHPHIVGTFGYSVRGILEKLSLIYPKIRLFERSETGKGLISKVAVRYLGSDGLVEIGDQQRYIDKYTNNRTPHTFWAVCEA